jgi:hypothetical protein
MKIIHWIYSLTVILSFLIIIAGCKKDKLVTIPVLSSVEPSDITDTTAISGGNYK